MDQFGKDHSDQNSFFAVMADTTHWIELEESDIYYVMSASEVDTLSNVQLQPGEYLATSQGQLVTNSAGQQFMSTPPVLTLVADFMRQVSLEVRGDISAGGYSLDDSPKIPELLKSHALSKVMHKLWVRLGGQLLDLDEGRKLMYNEAVEIFKLIRQGRYDGLPKAASTSPQNKEMSFCSESKLSL